MSGKFAVRFYDKSALREYLDLDGSAKKLVDIGLRKLEMRADEIGKPLGGALKNCKELKYRKAGIRVIFRVVGDGVEIVDIIAIGARGNGAVFGVAKKRLKR